MLPGVAHSRLPNMKRAFKLPAQWLKSVDWRRTSQTFTGPKLEYELRFASADNCLLGRYNSVHADPHAEAEDCFSQDWSAEVNWCHPPISCLDQLAAILREQPHVTRQLRPWSPPYWPGKAWFRELLGLAGDYRLVGTAADLADPQYLSRFKLRPPGAWPLVTFVIRA